VIERVEIAPGYSISRIIHGGWQFSRGHRLGASPPDDPVEVLMASAEMGITTFDCADIYTGVEDLYGSFLARWRSTSSVHIQIHTKFVPDYDDLSDVDKRYVERVIDRSLKRLGVERLDLVQFYWWRDDVPGLEETGLWLAELRDAGKIRHLATTNLDTARLERLESAGVRLVANQVQYSALDRRPEHGLAEYARPRGMQLLCYGTLAGGLLTDRWLGRAWGDAPDTRSLTKYRLIVDEFGGWEAYQSLLGTLRTIAVSHGSDIASVAVRFVLDQQAVGALIIGATRLGQMAGTAGAFDIALGEADHAAIRTHLDAANGPDGDVFDLERDRSGPHGSIMRYDLNRGGP
jgi:aryl-alcohol dehydrogenase-like predicted oxidoreductase